MEESNNTMESIELPINRQTSFQIQDYYIRSNSPVSMTDSYDGIDNNDKRYNSDTFEQEHNNSSSDEEINKAIKQRHSHRSDKYSDKLDILLTFIKGQKHFYSHCSRVCRGKLNMLMIPCMTISSLNAILTSIFYTESWTNPVSSALNTLILLFISVMNYLKYESSAEAFLSLHRNFDKLEMSIKSLHTDVYTYQENQEIENEIQKIERKIETLKEFGNPIIPSESRNLFPIIYQVNLSPLIRKFEVYKNQLYNRFSDIKNEIKYILMKTPIEDQQNDSVRNQRDQHRLLNLYQQKEQVKKQLAESASLYSHVDNIFSKEIRYANTQSIWFCMICNPPQKKTYNGLHPLIDQYFAFIFDEE
tara:strand:- start:1056 stop:2138 length:1083 start_codon:yes stop_codon:yes gene_type:complete